MPKTSLVKRKPTSRSYEITKNKEPDDDQPEISFGDIPGGLVPIGDSGLWITPDEPASPTDCERYDTSPYCTFDFFTLTPVSLEPSILVDECNIGVRLDLSIGFIRVPPIAIVYRNPSDACKMPLPPQAPPEGDNGLIPFPFNGCAPEFVSLIIYGASSKSSKTEWVDPITGDYYFAEFNSTSAITSIEYPYLGGVGRYTDSAGIEHPGYAARVNLHITHSYTMNANYAFEVWRFTDPKDYTSNYEGDDSLFVFFSGNTIDNKDPDFVILAYMGGVIQAKERLKGLRNTSDTSPHYGTTSTNEQVVDGYRFLEQKFFIKIVCGVDESYKNNPPPPRRYNPPPRRCCMGCCPSQGEQDNSLLNLLIKKVDKLSKVVGVEDYPVSLPTTLISRDEGFLGNLIPNFNEDVPSLTRFLSWYVQRFDEIMGQWEIPIQVKDSDPSQPGDQPLGIKLPNMAEAIAEMFTLVFQTNLNSETLLNMSMRTMAGAAADQQQNFITYKLLQSLTDWAGFKQKDISLKMPLLFTLNKIRYEEILQESEVEVGCVEFDEKFGLEADLMRFREAVAILQATSKVKLNPNADIKEQILKHLLDTYRGVGKVNGEDGDDDADFEKFINDVETGFIGTPGANETVNPYGKPFTQRPKIRDLSKKSPPTTPTP